MELQQDFQEREEKLEKKTWKKHKSEPTLIEALSVLTKKELDKIRKSYEFTGISTLKKADLANELAKSIPANLERILYKLDEERYYLLKNIVKNGGSIEDKGNLTLPKIIWLVENSIVFPSEINNEKNLVMPKEIVNRFNELDGLELFKVVKRNTEWINLIHGMLYYYGIMKTSLIIEKLREYTGEEIELLKFFKVLHSSLDYYLRIFYKGSFLVDERVSDFLELKEAQDARDVIPYYPFTKQQLLNASKEDYFDLTPEIREFRQYLIHHYEFEKEELDEICLDLTDMINISMDVSTIIQEIVSQMEIPSMDVLNDITGKIIKVNNTTRMWMLKGHKPSEIKRPTNNHPANVMNFDKSAPNVMSMDKHSASVMSK
ncbi:hypothetical protein CIB95_08840 [Lottiidibacillus patelloidae]|uniref:Rho termination factor N-terminal domain-containing protein n=1 Tax=Lottiidibacillus patelloidae TaxID=2670334 RepID=A0A263BU60_9BACI|nr:hypothetical protein [Lottiidibacillus patelloidae]OZM56867.1 hypothetical protein CIB95_08840 [Lottiidibacillus patelloidae]